MLQRQKGTVISLTLLVAAGQLNIYTHTKAAPGLNLFQQPVACAMSRMLRNFSMSPGAHGLPSPPLAQPLQRFAGIVERATDSEITTGTDDTRYISPKGFADNLSVTADASTTVKGIAELATDAEAVTGTDTGRTIVPSSLTARLEAPGAIGGTTPAAGTFTDLTSDGTLALQGGTVDIATDNAANAVEIGTGTTARAIGLGNSAAAHVIDIGSTTGAASLSLLAGTGNMDFDGNVATTYTMGNAAQTGTITIGSSSTTSTLELAAGAGASTVNIAKGIGGNTVSIANGINTSAQTINLAGGASGANSTVNILSGNGSAGTQTLNMVSGTRAGVVNIGNRRCCSCFDSWFCNRCCSA